MSKVHLVIPDSHAHPDHNNDRFTLLGHLIMDIRPDVIINIGDQADMPSLCSYEKGTGKFEGRRYRLDIQANREANANLFRPLHEFNEKQRRTSHKQYKPRTVFLYGNHEDRITRAVNQDPILEGTIGLQDLGNEQYWDEVHPFLSVVCIDGVHYSHYFTTGVMGRPISGEHQAYTMLSKHYVSCTQGHTHTRDYCERTAADGRRLQGLVCGAFMDYPSGWAGPAEKLWWNGVVIKREVKNGNYDLEFISIETLYKTYGDKL